MKFLDKIILNFDLFQNKRNNITAKLGFKNPIQIYYAYNTNFNEFLADIFNCEEVLRLINIYDEFPISFSLCKELNNKTKLKIISFLLIKYSSIKFLNSIQNSRILPTDIIIKKTAHGKPYLEFSKKVESKISIVAIGFRNLGIDIEKIRFFNSKLLKKIFSEDEFKNAKLFFKYADFKNRVKDINIAYSIMFSIKESVSKAIGLGLKLDFKKIKISIKEEIIKIKVRYMNVKQEYSAIYILKEDFVCTLVEQIN